MQNARDVVLSVVLLAACGDNEEPPVPTANLAREILATDLTLDLTTREATALITFAPSETVGATLEVGDLQIDDVMLDGAPLAFTPGPAIHLALDRSTKPLTVEIHYHFMHHEQADGASVNGYTITWPDKAQNIFPTHTNPADGSTYTLALTGVPAGMMALYPTEIAADAPSYQLAWSTGAYTELPLGTTAAGTQVSIWHFPADLVIAQRGTPHLAAAFDWLEKNIGPYHFGAKVGTVETAWRYSMVAPDFALGGMEHHPYWHITKTSLDSHETHVHEAAHGWYGDGVRIACWEDMVLSEGTTTYLAARSLEAVAPTVGAALFTSYEQAIGVVANANSIWPDSCGVEKANAQINGPVYMRGAMFYRSLANKLGAPVVDQVLSAFYMEHALGAARMTDMLDAIHAMTGYDPTACANTWLRTSAKPTSFVCP